MNDLMQGRAGQGSARAIICADDFAMTEGISASILELAAAGCISATGAMTNRPHWQVWGPRLMAMRERIDIGLHFNLTCAQPLTSMPTLAPCNRFPALARVMRLGLTSPRARTEIAAELSAQLDAFEEVAGCAPDFIDGHQHVHAMPGIRQIVLPVLAGRYLDRKPYLRDPHDGFLTITRRGVEIKKAILISTLAEGFSRQACAWNFATNAGFSGVSGFDPNRDFNQDMAAFLTVPGVRHLVMVHPGFIDAELYSIDPVIVTRPIEHAALLKGGSKLAFTPARFGDFT
jgi:chitin disaccharide deacetylase